MSAAVTAFPSDARAYYQSLFTEMGTNVPRFTDVLRNVDSVTFGRAGGEIIVTDAVLDAIHAYPIGVWRDDQGVWRLSGM